MIFLVSFLLSSVLAVSNGLKSTAHSHKDVIRSINYARDLKLTGDHIMNMIEHDEKYELHSDQLTLLCGPYSYSTAFKDTLTAFVDENQYHPVYYSKRDNRVCYSLSNDVTTEQQSVLKNVGNEAVLTTIPSALKINANAINIIKKLSEHDTFELFYGIGVGKKGLKHNVKHVTNEIISKWHVLQTDIEGRRRHMEQFYWSNKDNKLNEHVISKSFSTMDDAKIECSHSAVQFEYNRMSVSLSNLHKLDTKCMLLLLSVATLHSDVSSIVVHNGYKLMSKSVISSNDKTEPYNDATPPTDQNAFIQSGNSVDTPYTDLGINGSSYVVGYIDSGLDDLSCFFIDDSGTETPRTPADDYATPITDYSRRKVIQYIAWADGSPAIDYDHGTWCAGSTAGQCINATSSANLYNGVAVSAKVTMFDVDIAATDDFVNVPSLYDICLPPSYGAGARVHSNSWGTPGMTSYTSKSLDVDEFTYENPDFLFIVAASNDGADGYKSVGSPGVAKNALTIGATASKHNELVYFSSIGPVYDGSIKPDIVAPGHNLMSAGVRDSTLGQNLSCNVQLSSGTSMATPIAAGAAVVIREYMESAEYWGKTCTSTYQSCPIVNPSKSNNFISGALLKAALIHSGEPISSHQAIPGYNTIPAGNLSIPPDVFQGWGQVLLKNVLPVPGVYDFNLYVADYQPIQSLYARYYFVEVTDTSIPLRVTISWTDPANAVWAAKNLLNDLDLIIFSPKGYGYFGNNIEGDEHNPSERYVQLPGQDVELGYYTIAVVAKQLATQSQNFGIVITSIGEVDETRTFTAAANLDYELHYENATEICEGTFSKPTGNALVRFQLEDWNSGASWEGLNFYVKNDLNAVVSSCTFQQNAENSAAPYTRSSQCSVCLPANGVYTAVFDPSQASANGESLVRVATVQCDNIFLSKRQTSSVFNLYGGTCNYCPSGYSRITAFMQANVTNDDYTDYSWYGEAFWSIALTSNKATPLYSGTLTISDAEADRYCIPNGDYYFTLDDSLLFSNTGRHAAVTFSVAGDDANSLTLSGLSGVLSGYASVGTTSESWYESSKLTPVSSIATSGFGSSVSQYVGFAAVGSPYCLSGCTGGGSVSIYQVQTSKFLQDVNSSVTDDLFGYSVSMTDGLFAVGAPADNSVGLQAGKVYVYTYSTSNSFSLVNDSVFLPPEGSSGAMFGTSVSIFLGSGDVVIPEDNLPSWLAVGAPKLNITGMTTIYYKAAATVDVPSPSWALVGSVWPPSSNFAANFGSAVGWFSDLLVSAGLNNETNQGFVVVYANNYPDIPQLTKVLYAMDASANDQFGFSVALFRAGSLGNYGYALAVGAPGVARAYVFTYNGVSWTQNSRLIAAAFDPLDTPSLFGTSVSVNEDSVMIGSPGTGSNTGSVVAFIAVNQSSQVPKVSWSQQAVLIASTSKAGDRFGSSVGVYASNVIAGAPGSTSVAYSGTVYQFIESITAAPTQGPSKSDEDSNSNDDEWATLDSYNNLAILITCLGAVFVIVVGVAVYFFLLAPKSAPLLGNMN